MKVFSPAKQNVSQIVPIGLLGIGLVLFVFSAFNYQNLGWFPWLLGSRIGLVALAFALVIYLSTNATEFRNWHTLYFTVVLAAQASWGILENPMSVEFYSYCGLLYILAALTYSGSFSQWAHSFGVVQLTFLFLPILFKDESLRSSFRDVVDHFSMAFAYFIIGVPILKLNCDKFIANKERAHLHRELMLQKEKALEQEREINSEILEKLEKARLKIEKESKLAALGQVATQVAHDIASPLVALNFTLKDADLLPKENAEIMKGAVARIQAISEGLLKEYRRSQSLGGESDEPVREVVMLLPLVEEVLREKRCQYRERPEVSFETKNLTYGVFCGVEENDFKRLLSNIINNAVEATWGSGVVTVSMEVTSERMKLVISDQGRGIPTELLTKVTESGFTAGKASGSGLGLFHARECASSWNGNLSINSVVGEGTRVELDLPLASAPSWFVSELAVGKETEVVIVDDEKEVHQSWEKRFSHRPQVRLHHFFEPEGVMKWFLERPASSSAPLFLVDYELPGSQYSGLSLVERLGVGARAVMVSSAARELTNCYSKVIERLGVRLLPKAWVHSVPIREITH